MKVRAQKETAAPPVALALAAAAPGLYDGRIRTGAVPTRSKVLVVEFADFQCPFCARAAERLAALEAEWPDALTVIHRHFPLTERHPHAWTAAIASECAHQQGRIVEFRKVAFSRQAEIGIREWEWFAQEAGVDDLSAFNECMKDDGPADAVREDVQLGNTIGVPATPAFVVRDKMYIGQAALDVVERLLRG
jgi:protein-disulfide isomerase